VGQADALVLIPTVPFRSMLFVWVIQPTQNIRRYSCSGFYMCQV